MIDFEHVSKTYPNGTKALKDFNLHIDKGEFVFVVGSSGAGKSTFLKTLICEEKVSDGRILVDGVDVAHMKKSKVPYLRRKMGIVFQNFRLIPNMTVYENVAFAMHVIGSSDRLIRKRVPYVLGMVGLQDKMKCLPSELSGGQQQSVGLARALVNNPELIIADEPTGNIDPELSFEIVDLLTRINERGTTVIMVTHEHNLVKHFGKRIVDIEHGTVVADTSNPEIMANYVATMQQELSKEAEARNTDFAEAIGFEKDKQVVEEVDVEVDVKVKEIVENGEESASVEDEKNGEEEK